MVLISLWKERDGVVSVLELRRRRQPERDSVVPLL